MIALSGYGIREEAAMSKGRHARGRRVEREDKHPTPDGGSDDFADEHTSTTFADEMPGGPEGREEPETPKGKAGDGGMDVEERS